MNLPSWLKESSVYLAVFAVAAALPTYLWRFKIGPIPATALELVILAAIAVLIVHLTHPVLSLNKNGGAAEQFGKNKLLAVGAGLIALATAIGVIVSPDKQGALGIAKAYFWEPMLLAALIIAARPDKEKLWRACLAGLAASALVVVIYSLLQYTHPALIPATWTAERRITSVFDFPNAAALYLAPLLPLFLSSPVAIALSAFSVLVTVLAKSAGGIIAMAAAIFFLGVWKKKTRTAIVLLAIAGAAAVFFLPAAAGVREQLLMRDWSGRVHQIGWKESLAMLKDHPLFGAGLDGFRTAVAPYHHAQGVEIFQYPHNLFLAVWSELGLLGLAGFALIFIWYFKNGLAKPAPSPYQGENEKMRAINIILVASMIAVLVHGLVDVPYFKNDLAMMFWLFIILMAR